MFSPRLEKRMSDGAANVVIRFQILITHILLSVGIEAAILNAEFTRCPLAHDPSPPPHAPLSFSKRPAGTKQSRKRLGCALHSRRVGGINLD